jgi:hypothetical protein
VERDRRRRLNARRLLAEPFSLHTGRTLDTHCWCEKDSIEKLELVALASVQHNGARSSAIGIVPSN